MDADVDLFKFLGVEHKFNERQAAMQIHITALRGLLSQQTDVHAAPSVEEYEEKRMVLTQPLAELKEKIESFHQLWMKNTSVDSSFSEAFQANLKTKKSEWVAALQEYLESNEYEQLQLLEQEFSTAIIQIEEDFLKQQRTLFQPSSRRSSDDFVVLDAEVT